MPLSGNNTTDPPNSDSNMGAAPGQPPLPHPGRRLLIFAGMACAAVVIFGSISVIRGLGERRGPASGPNFPAPGIMPDDFDRDHSPEAVAFRATCSQCHVYPNPKLHDRAGWAAVRSKMAGQIADRGLAISDRQLDLAVAYAVRHGQPQNHP